MTDETPLDGTPEPEVAAPRREPQAWLALGLLFSVLIILAVASTFLGEVSNKRSYAPELKMLEDAFRERSSMSQAEFLKQLNAIEVLVKGSRNDDERAGRIYAVTQLEKGGKLSRADLLALQKGSRHGNAFAHLVGQQKMTQSLFDKANKGFQPEDFADSYAVGYAAEKAGLVPNRRAYFPTSRWQLHQFFVYGASVMSLVGIGTIAYWWRRRVMGAPLADSPQMPMSLLDADRCAMRTFLCLAAFAAVPIFGGMFTSSLQSEVASLTKSLGVLVLCALAIRMKLFGQSDSVSHVVGNKEPVGKLLGYGVLGACAALPVVGVLASFGAVVFRFLPEPTHPAAERVVGFADPMILVATFISASIFAPLMEETLFRGLLLPALERLRSSRVFAVVVSSLLFSAIHPQGIPMWLALGGVGAVAAILVYETGSLIPCYVMHAMFNGVILTMGALGN